MKKTISLFQRNYESDRLVRNEVVPGAEWVLNGEGVATQKIDGTSCLIDGGHLFKRLEVKEGRIAPDNFVAATEVDPNTGKQQGWIPVGDGPEDKWHNAASLDGLPDGSYELVGPKVQGNRDGYFEHTLVPHTATALSLYDEPERNFEAIRDYLKSHNIEGIVWHHPDGRWVKIKGKDFGFKRNSISLGQES